MKSTTIAEEQIIDLVSLVLGLLIGRKKFDHLPSARRYFNANLNEAISLIGGL